MSRLNSLIALQIAGIALVACATTTASKAPAPPVPPVAAKVSTPEFLGISTFAGSCSWDDEIDTAKKAEINLTASSFLDAVLGASPGLAVQRMSTAGAANLTPAKLIDGAAVIHRDFDPQAPRVEHTYLLHLEGHAENIVCAADVSRPDGWESMKAADVPEQAYVVASAFSRKEKVAFVFWLVPENGVWKVQGFSTNYASSGGKTAVELWELARAEQTKGHDFNTVLLLANAAFVANRGPYLRLGIAQAISLERSKARMPSEISGSPPWAWIDGGAKFTVLQVGPMTVGGKIYVDIDHEVAAGSSDQEMVISNNAILSYFKRRFPEYATVFAGLHARAHEKGTNRGYGSVEELLR